MLVDFLITHNRQCGTQQCQYKLTLMKILLSDSGSITNLENVNG